MMVNTETYKNLSPFKKITAWVSVIAVVLGGIITLTGYFGKGFFASFATKEDLLEIKSQLQRLEDSESMERAQWGNIKTNADNDIDLKVRIGVVEKMLDLKLNKEMPLGPVQPTVQSLNQLKDRLKKDRYSKSSPDRELKEFIQQQRPVQNAAPKGAK